MSELTFTLASVYTLFVKIRLARDRGVCPCNVKVDMRGDQILISYKMLFLWVLSFYARHQRPRGTNVYTAKTSLTVVIVKPTVEHRFLTAILSFGKLKDHVGAGAVTKAAVDAFSG